MGVATSITDTDRMSQPQITGDLTAHHSPLTTHQVGMLTFLASEVAFFGTSISSGRAAKARRIPAKFFIGPGYGSRSSFQRVCFPAV